MSMNQDTIQIMQYLTEIVNSYLNQEISNRKFKGTIVIELNCNDGGIGTISTMIKRNHNRSDIFENNTCG